MVLSLLLLSPWCECLWPFKTYPSNTLTLLFQAAHNNCTSLHRLDIYHVGTQSSSAFCIMLMRPNEAETAVHGCWLLSFIFKVATGFYPFYHCRLSAHVCSFNIPFQHFDFDQLVD